MDDGGPESGGVGETPPLGRSGRSDLPWASRLLRWTPIILFHDPEPDRLLFGSSMDDLPPKLQLAHARLVAGFRMANWLLMVPWCGFASAFVIWALLRLDVDPSWPGLVIVIGPMVLCVAQSLRWNRRTGRKGVAWRQRYVKRALAEAGHRDTARS